MSRAVLNGEIGGDEPDTFHLDRHLRRVAGEDFLVAGLDLLTAGGQFLAGKVGHFPVLGEQGGNGSRVSFVIGFHEIGGGLLQAGDFR